MKVFLGSSLESAALLLEVATWVEELGHDVVLWNAPGTFLPGENTLLKLIKICNEVDAAIFLFSEDDKIWYRQDLRLQPRDNVLLEYGMFTGAIGVNRSIICRRGEAKIPGDLAGLTYIDISETRKHDAKLRFLIWMRRLSEGGEVEEFAQHKIQQAMLKSKISELEKNLEFERTAKSDLRDLLEVRSNGNEDSGKYKNFVKLFYYDSFWAVAEIFYGFVIDARLEFAYILEESGVPSVSELVSTEHIGNREGGRWLTGKFLRAVRRLSPIKFETLVSNLPDHSKVLIENIKI